MFGANETNTTVCIKITDDNILECTERFKVNIVNETVCSDYSTATIVVNDHCKIFYRLYNKIEFIMC